MPDGHIVGIETSCDETGAAVVRSGQRILSNVIASQIATHRPYGGVVPELASREHLRAIVPVVRQALAEAGQTYASVDAISVTQGPGLAGALLGGSQITQVRYFSRARLAGCVQQRPGETQTGVVRAAANEEGRHNFL